MTALSQTKTSTKIRLNYIDALRGIAALMVLICHSLQVDSSLILPKSLSESFESGKYGVQLFFVISALTIFYSLYNSDKNTTNFFIRRFFRIAPLYFLGVAVYSWIYNVDLQGIGLNLAFLHGFSPQYINSVVPGGWSIGIEMVFYCMIPFLFRKIFNLKKAIYFFLFSLIFSFVCMYVYKKVFTSTSSLESFVYFWLPNQLPVFGLGFIVYFLSFGKKEIDVRSVFFPCILLCALIMFCIITKLPILKEHVIFAFAAAIVIFLLSKRSLPGVVNKGSLYLGKVSYSLYLSQYAAIEILKKTGFFSFIPGIEGKAAILNLLINLGLLFVTTVLLSTVLFHLIEQPFQSVGKKIIKSRYKNQKIEVSPILVNPAMASPVLTEVEK
jgi:peptidoglycan/LPS O-acetylase OafA/YrhL